MHQDVGARRAIGLRGVFQLIVADAVLAGHEHHRRRHHGVEVAGVVAGAGGDAAVRIAERLRGVLDRVDQFGLKCVGGLRQTRSSVTSTLRRAAISAIAARKSLSSASMIAASALRQSTVKAISPGMTLREGLAITASPMVPTAFGPCFLAMRLHRQHDFRQRRQRVAPQRHRRRAGMALEAGDLAVVPEHALAGIDHADGLVLGLQDRALLDMQFDEAREFLACRPGSSPR